MRAATGRAPSKLILLGEHAVVYGHPAVAVPLQKPGAEASVVATEGDAPVAVELKDFDIRWSRGEDIPADEVRPFAELVGSVSRRYESIPENGWSLSVSSEIPIGCGLGSGAAVSVAAFRAVFRCFGVPHTPRELSDSAYEIEKIHHGTPSGIDNTVIATGRPVLFRKGAAPDFLNAPEAPVFLVVGYTGVRHKTVEIVSDVAKARAADRAAYDAMFREIGDIARRGAEAFENGAFEELGGLMGANQRLLERIGVSSPELDGLVRAAQKAGALGAKLSGAGRGGCMAALAADRASAERLKGALESAGAAAAVVATVLERGKGS
ncbi:MAG: mevalonate kinase [Elusimicrobiota bacterium]